MQNLEKLKTLAEALPKTHKAAALALVEKMGEVIEGLGDKPVEWKANTLKLVQGTTDRSKLPKGANIGSFVLGEEVKEQPLKVIPLRHWTTRQYWSENIESAQMICSSPDGVNGFRYGECRACPYQKFDTEKNKSQCNKTMTALIAMEDLSDVFLVNFSKTNYANGLDWAKLMKQAGVLPFKRTYTLASETSKKSKNVETIRAEPLVDKKVEGDILAFVEELFRISGEDRKISLELFNNYLSSKKNNQEVLSAPADNSQVLLTVTEDTSGVVQNAESQPSGKKYAV